MPKYLFVYHGGSAPESEEAGEKAMAAWMKWFGSMGDDVIDGGSPVGASSTVKSNGRVVKDGGANPTTGYSVVRAKDLKEALARAKGCPILADGGSVEVAETFEP